MSKHIHTYLMLIHMRKMLHTKQLTFLNRDRALLSDVTATILKLLGLKPTPDMTGKSLF